MSKKVKCLECENCMRFAIPAKQYLESDFTRKAIETRIVCGQTMKEKFDTNEQYCKHFIPASEGKIRRNSREHVIAEIVRKGGVE